MKFDFRHLMSGEKYETGTQTAYRFWRYKLNPLQLKSWVSDKEWMPGQITRGTCPDQGEQGIHGYKTLSDLMWSVRGSPEKLLYRAQELTGHDGVIVGTVELWGIIWDHAYGYRAEFARPTSFVSAYGRNNDVALTKFREHFHV